MNTSSAGRVVLGLLGYVNGNSKNFLALILGALAILWNYSMRTKSRLPLPPGPKPLPIIGNLLDFPFNKPWLVYDEWFRQYGDIIHINVLGQPMIILGSTRRTFDLFEKCSSIYLDRIHLPMFELMGLYFGLAIMRYGSWWRRHRKLFHEHFCSIVLAGLLMGCHDS